MERTVCPGEFYRHFKNRLYQVIAVALHSETGERMVVYQALYGNFQVYVRPYEMFVSEVDHQKYPEVKQRWRFERVTPGGGPGHAGTRPACGESIAQPLQNDADAGRKEDWQEPAEPEREPNPALLRFLDTDNYEEQMACLRELEKTASQSDVDSIYVVLDMKPVRGDIPAQLRAAAQYLSLRDHFDGRRLR